MPPREVAHYDPSGPNAPLAWYGGKRLQAHWIIEQMPAHRTYLDPYGGMANVLLKKNPSEVEIFNDRDGRVVNLFRVIQDPTGLAELKRRCELTPYARRTFIDYCQSPEPTDPIKRAHRFFVLAGKHGAVLGRQRSAPPPGRPAP